MVKINKFLVSIFLVINYSCVPVIHNKKKFDIQKHESINEIKTNGYYYSKSKSNESIVARLLFADGFYKELGIVNSEINNEYFKKYCETIQNNSFKNLECMMDNYEYFFKIDTNFLNRKSEIWDWGKFEIKDGKIRVQYFYNLFGDYYLIEEKGNVINNESFIICSRYYYRNGKQEDVNITYFFKEYDISKSIDFKPKKGLFFK